MVHRFGLRLSFCFLGIHKVNCNPSPGLPTFTGRTSYPSSQIVSENVNGGLSASALNSSQTPSFSSTASNGSHVLASTITISPSMTSNALDYDEKGGRCTIGLGDQNCTNIGVTTTVLEPGPPLHLKDECLLWNASCTGNRTLALDEFFERTLAFLQENECFVHHENPSCSKLVSPDTMSEFAVIKTWMRSPQCLSSSSEHQVIQGGTPMPYTLGTTCCDICQISAQNVDIYYWPDPNANTSCLSIVGSGVNPPLYGATSVITMPVSPFNTTITYWGCTAQDPSSGLSYITTALLTSRGSITFKEPLLNPWSVPPCVETASALPGLSTSIESRTLYPSIHARGHSLVLPPNITQNDGQPASTVVMGGFTL